jgi:hypothetical protein
VKRCAESLLFLGCLSDLMSYPSICNISRPLCPACELATSSRNLLSRNHSLNERPHYHLPKMPSAEHYDATVKILEGTVDHASANHAADPKEHLHRPATHSVTHSFFDRFLPREHIEAIESRWHLGNYVIDRKTGEKHFEEMNIYVRIGSMNPLCQANQSRT